ncbi:hypothetical protein SAMN05421734_11317 [Pelagirhabdus alkalitolerans]|uniref:BhlA holin family protein n=1 Tax=Pelagirhabdus alkalitolerans TaxID=1612202 RepID=A0A1G6MZE4_9BACI|nr:ABC transporter ATP-binding protein [Pelagirhabdus alkalitolerans]SDC60791.1 hypothetical protein SAMN05421734_11317 [Pelagirhabdus alkalitolerans]
MGDLIFITIVLFLIYLIYSIRKFAKKQEKKMEHAQNDYNKTIEESHENVQIQRDILQELKEIRKSIDNKTD